MTYIESVLYDQSVDPVHKFDLLIFKLKMILIQVLYDMNWLKSLGVNNTFNIFFKKSFIKLLYCEILLQF